MKLTGKKVLVLGLGLSGVSICQALEKEGVDLIIKDDKEANDLKEELLLLEGIPASYYLGSDNPDLEEIDLLVKSPGISLDNETIKLADQAGVKVITDLELYYLLEEKSEILAITGTNGKTTITSLVGEILSRAGKDIKVAGNIGLPVMDIIKNKENPEYTVIEASSFQLNGTDLFKPKVSLIINLSPDHLDWHGTYEAYIDSKFKIFQNQGKDDYTILNYDDLKLRRLEGLKSQVIWISKSEALKKGVYLKGDKIISTINGEPEVIMDVTDINIILDNALAAIALGLCLGISKEIIQESVKKFRALEHRIEFVREVKGVKYYNDSKGTNPESTKKAIDLTAGPIILIAGGYDKNSDYRSLLERLKPKHKALILLGQTRYKIEKEARDLGFENIYLVEDMLEAVNLSKDLAGEGDSVLLSPACASWGQYRNFEERGWDFKRLVNEIR